MNRVQQRISIGVAAVLAAGLSMAGPARLDTQASGTMAPMKPTPSMGMMSMTPKEGGKALDFTLTAIDGTKARLSAEEARGPVVLVVLRGWPGYQCPFCTRQFGEYLARANDLEATGAKVLFVYPGPADGLKDHAIEFTKSAPLPASYRVLLDPDYTFTNAYGLRWNETGETAYPSTFVIGKDGVVTFSRTSHKHDDRVPVADVLTALGRVKR